MNRVFRSCALTLLLFTSMNVNAALVIDYSSGEKGYNLASNNTAASDKTLLLDNSVEWSKKLGSCEPFHLTGSASKLGVANALRMFLPAGWKVFADDDLSLDGITLSWVNGEIWTDVIASAAKSQQFRALIDCDRKFVNFSRAPDLGSFGQAQTDIKAFDSIFSQQKSFQQASSSSSESKQKTNIHKVEPYKVEPYKGETVQGYFKRFAKQGGFSRTAFKIQSKKINTVLRRAIHTDDSKRFSLENSLEDAGLFIVTGRDVVTNAAVSILTDDVKLSQVNGVLVFPISSGMISENAIHLASIFHKSIGENNIWPLDIDFQVPYGYDIVMVDPVDGFKELFDGFPLQAQLIIGTDIIDVVHRVNINRN